MKLLFEFLKDFDLVKRNRVNASLVQSMPRRDLYKVVEVLTDLTETQRPNSTKTAFSYSASQSLASRWNCTFLPHRLDQLNHLANFAALYSDCVYVENFFLDLQTL
jgi:hypothetical protein